MSNESSASSSSSYTSSSTHHQDEEDDRFGGSSEGDEFQHLVVDDTNNSSAPPPPASAPLARPATAARAMFAKGGMMFDDDDEESTTTSGSISDGLPLVDQFTRHRDPTVAPEGQDSSSPTSGHSSQSDSQEPLVGEQAISQHFIDRRRKFVGDGPETFAELDGRPATRGETGLFNAENDDFAQHALRADYDSDIDATTYSSSSVAFEPSDPTTPTIHSSRVWNELLLLNAENGNPLDQVVHCLGSSKYQSDFVALPKLVTGENTSGEKSAMLMRVLSTPFHANGAAFPISLDGCEVQEDGEDGEQWISGSTRARIRDMLAVKLRRIGEGNPFASLSAPLLSSECSQLSHFQFSGAAVDDRLRLIAQHEIRPEVLTDPGVPQVSLHVALGMAAVRRHFRTIFSPNTAVSALLEEAVEQGAAPRVIHSTLTADEALRLIYTLARSLKMASAAQPPHNSRGSNNNISPTGPSTGSKSAAYTPHGNLSPHTITVQGTPHKTGSSPDSFSRSDLLRFTLSDPLHTGFAYPFLGSSSAGVSEDISHFPPSYISHLIENVILPEMAVAKREGADAHDPQQGMTLQQRLFLRYEELENKAFLASSSHDSLQNDSGATNGEEDASGYVVAEYNDVFALGSLLFRCIVGHGWLHGLTLLQVCERYHQAGSTSAWIDTLWSFVESAVNSVSSPFAGGGTIQLVKTLLRDIVVECSVATLEEFLDHAAFDCISHRRHQNAVAIADTADLVSDLATDCSGFLLQSCVNGGGGGKWDSEEYEGAAADPPSPLSIIASKGPFGYQHPLLAPFVASIANRMHKHTTKRIEANLTAVMAAGSSRPFDAAAKKVTAVLVASQSVDVVAWCSPVVQHAIVLFRDQLKCRLAAGKSNVDCVEYLDGAVQAVVRGGKSHSRHRIEVDHMASTLSIQQQQHASSNSQTSNDDENIAGDSGIDTVEISPDRLLVISYLAYLKDLFASVVGVATLADDQITQMLQQLDVEDGAPSVQPSHVSKMLSTPHSATSTFGVVAFEEDDEVEAARNREMVRALMKKKSNADEKAPSREQSPEPVASLSVASAGSELPSIDTVHEMLVGYVEWATSRPPPDVPSNLLVNCVDRLHLTMTTSFRTISVCDARRSRLLLGSATGGVEKAPNPTPNDAAGTSRGILSSPVEGVCQLSDIHDCDLVAVASRQLTLHGEIVNVLVSTLLVDNPICVGKALLSHPPTTTEEFTATIDATDSLEPALTFYAGEALLRDVQFVPYCLVYQGFSSSATGCGKTGMVPEYASAALSFPLQGDRRLPFQRILTDITIDEAATSGGVDLPMPRLPGSERSVQIVFDTTPTPTKTALMETLLNDPNAFVKILAKSFLASSSPPKRAPVVRRRGNAHSVHQNQRPLETPDAFFLPCVTNLTAGPFVYEDKTADLTLYPGELSGRSRVILRNIHGGLVLDTASRMEQQARRAARREARMARRMRRVELMASHAPASDGIPSLMPSVSSPRQRHDDTSGFQPQHTDITEALSEGLAAALHGLTIAEVRPNPSEQQPAASASALDKKVTAASSYTNAGVFHDKFSDFLERPCEDADAQAESADDSTPTTDSQDDEEDEAQKNGRSHRSRRGSTQLSVAGSAITDFDDGQDDGELEPEEDSDDGGFGFWGMGDGGTGMGNLLVRQNESVFDVSNFGGEGTKAGSSKGSVGRRKSGASTKAGASSTVLSVRKGRKGRGDKSGSSRHIGRPPPPRQQVNFKRKDKFLYSCPSIVILDTIRGAIVERVSRATIVLCAVGYEGVVIRGCEHCTFYIVTLGGNITIEGGQDLTIHAYVLGDVTAPSMSSDTAGGSTLPMVPIVMKEGPRTLESAKHQIFFSLSTLIQSSSRDVVSRSKNSMPMYGSADANAMGCSAAREDDDDPITFPLNVVVHPLIMNAPQLDVLVADLMANVKPRARESSTGDEIGRFLYDYSNQMCDKRWLDNADEVADEAFREKHNIVFASAPSMVYVLSVPHLPPPCDLLLQQRKIAASLLCDSPSTSPELPTTTLEPSMDAATTEKLRAYAMGMRGVVDLNPDHPSATERGSLPQQSASMMGVAAASTSLKGFHNAVTSASCSPELHSGGGILMGMSSYRLTPDVEDDVVRGTADSDDDPNSSRPSPPLPATENVVPSVYIPLHIQSKHAVCICNLCDCSILRVDMHGLAPLQSGAVNDPPEAEPDVVLPLAITASQTLPLRGDGDNNKSSLMAEFTPVFSLSEDDTVAAPATTGLFSNKGANTTLCNNVSALDDLGRAGNCIPQLVISRIAGGVIHIAAPVETLVISNCLGPLDIVVSAAKTVLVENCVGVTLQCACFEIAIFSSSFCHFALHTNCAPRIFSSVDVAASSMQLATEAESPIVSSGCLTGSSVFSGDGNGGLMSAFMNSGGAAGVRRRGASNSPPPVQHHSHIVTLTGRSSYNRFSTLHIASAGLLAAMELLGIDPDVNLYDDPSRVQASRHTEEPQLTDENDNVGDDAEGGSPVERFNEDVDGGFMSKGDSDAGGLLLSGPCVLHGEYKQRCNIYCVAAANQIAQKEKTKVADTSTGSGSLEDALADLEFPMWLRPMLMVLSAAPPLTSNGATTLFPFPSLHLFAYLLSQLVPSHPVWFVAPPMHCTVLCEEAQSTDNSLPAPSSLLPPDFLSRRVYFEVGKAFYDPVHSDGTEGGVGIGNLFLNGKLGGFERSVRRGSVFGEKLGRPLSRREELDVQRIVDEVLTGGNIFLSESCISNTLMDITQSAITVQGNGAESFSNSTPRARAASSSQPQVDDATDEEDERSSSTPSLGSSASCTSNSLRRRRRSTTLGSVSLREAVLDHLPRVQAMVKCVSLIRVVVDVCEQHLLFAPPTPETSTAGGLIGHLGLCREALARHWGSVVEIAAHEVESLVEDPVDELVLLRLRLWLLEKRVEYAQSGARAGSGSGVLDSNALLRLFKAHHVSATRKRAARIAAEKIVRYSVEASEATASQASLPATSYTPPSPLSTIGIVSAATTFKQVYHPTVRHPDEASPIYLKSPTTYTASSPRICTPTSPVPDDIESVGSTDDGSGDDFSPMRPLNDTIAEALAIRKQHQQQEHAAAVGGEDDLFGDEEDALPQEEPKPTVDCSLKVENCDDIDDGEVASPINLSRTLLTSEAPQETPQLELAANGGGDATSSTVADGGAVTVTTITTYIADDTTTTTTQPNLQINWGFVSPLHPSLQPLFTSNLNWMEQLAREEADILSRMEDSRKRFRATSA